MSTHRHFFTFLLPVLGLVIVQSAGTAAHSLQVRNSAGNCAKCGIKFPPNRIINGKEAEVNEWPWQVRLSIHTPNGIFLCGGAVYKTRYVITAAHCLEWKVRKIVVHIGAHKLLGKGEPNEQIFLATEFHQHEGWKHNKNDIHDEDIAIVTLDKPVTFTERVRPICLPEQNEGFSGLQGWVTGWGITEAGATNVLRKAKITVWSDERCQNMGKTSNMLCGLGTVHDLTIDSCQGDSGSPLVHEEADGRWVLAGIVSHGPNPCAQAGKPGIYTRVSNYVDWLNKITADGEC